MYFGIINTKYQVNNIVQEHIRERFEYVFHYWTFLFSNYRFDTTISKFESHRTLLNKIDLQLKHNIDHAKEYLKLIFVLSNPLFDGQNLLIKNNCKRSSAFKIKLSEFKTSITTSKGVFSNPSKTIKDFIYLKNTLLKNYAQFLTDNLYKLLIINRPLSIQDKSDLNFLINSFIAELFHYGYEKDFISYVISAITMTSHPMDESFNFPFNKTKFDFSTDEEFKNYIAEEKKNISLRRQIDCLVNLLQRKKQKGFAIFKIKNFVPISANSLLIWGVEFYRPKTDSKLKGGHHENAEDLFKQEAIESTCNAIVPFSIPDISFVSTNVMNEVDKSVNALHYIFGINAEIDKSNCILANEKLDRYFLVPNRKEYSSLVSMQFDAMDQELLSKYNRLSSDNELHNNIQILISLLGKISINKNLASIKDLWITIESLFNYKTKPKERKEELIALANSCYKLNLRKYFTTNNYYYLLSAFMPRFGASYAISQEEYNKKDNLNGMIPKSEAKKFITGLTKAFHVEFLIEFKNKTQDAQLFYDSEITKWIYYTINHAYAERNLEVHNNIKNELTYTFLIDNIKRIMIVIVHALLENIDTKNKSAEILFNKINLKANKIISL
jgi:hypothetical protein